MQVLGKQGPDFKKPPSVRGGKFVKVLLFDAPCGWGEVPTLRGKAVRGPAGDWGLRGTSLKMRRRGRLESVFGYSS